MCITHLDHKTTVRVGTAVTDAVGFMCRAHKFRIGLHSIVFVQSNTSTHDQHHRERHAMYCRERDGVANTVRNEMIKRLT